jgi:hypothetical protein
VVVDGPDPMSRSLGRDLLAWAIWFKRRSDALLGYFSSRSMMFESATTSWTGDFSTRIALAGYDGLPAKHEDGDQVKPLTARSLGSIRTDQAIRCRP